jgi:tetratricopeptide (TPR) repeat protein
MASVNVFLSAVTAEFRSYRDLLRSQLQRPNVTVHVQEDFIPTGTETLDKLDRYIGDCDAVIHLCGDMTGAWATEAVLQNLKSRYADLVQRLPALKASIETGQPPLSYTQWEAYLAVYHRKALLIATPESGTPRDPKFQLDAQSRQAQRAHLDRLQQLGRYAEITFANADQLASRTLRSAILDLLAKAGTVVRAKPITLPYRSIGTLFKGRAEFIARLRDQLQQATVDQTNSIVGRALSGLGGVGKTRLAVEYAWQHLDDYSALLFVGAQTPEVLQQNIAALAGPLVLDLPEHNEKDQEIRVKAALRWLQNNPCWFLIIDNVDSPAAAEDAEKLLTRLHGGHVVITGRIANWSAQVEVLDLDVLALDDAQDFLLKRTENRRKKNDDDPAQARALARELGQLALALEQAGAYISRHRLSFAEYVALWNTNWDKVAAWFDARVVQYHNSIAVTWQMSFDALLEADRQLLYRLSWLSPDPIPVMLLDVPVPSNPGETDLRDELANLEDYSLATRSHDALSFTIHRLVQDVTRRSLRRLGAPARDSLTRALRWIDAAFVGNPQDVRNWHNLDALAPHVLAVAEHGAAANVPEPTSRLMNDLSILLLQKGRFADAEAILRRSIAICEKASGPDSHALCRPLGNLAIACEALGRYAEGEDLLKRAIVICEKVLGPDHAEVGVLLNSLGENYRKLGRFDEAEPLYQRALAIVERRLGPEHADVAVILNNLAILYQSRKRHPEAEALLQRSLAIREKTYGPDHPDVATALHNLALTLEENGRHSDAEKLLRRALTINEKAFGAEHFTVGYVLKSLAAVCNHQDRISEGESLYQRALAILEKSYGPEHLELAPTLNNLAVLYQKQQRFAEAEPLYKRQLVIEEKSLGPDHPSVAKTLSNLAALYDEQGRDTEAEQLYRRIIAINQKLHGRLPLDMARIFNNLAFIYRKQERNAEAQPFARQCIDALVAASKQAGSEHPQLGFVLLNYIGLLTAMGKSEAERSDEIDQVLREIKALTSA